MRKHHINNKGIDVRLEPLLKWPGGKERELKYIIPNLPQKFVDYYEPFVGGGAVYTAIRAERHFINDKSLELILLYNSITGCNRHMFFDALDEVTYNWDLLTAIVKENEMFFIDLYKRFSQDKISETEMREFLLEFISRNEFEFKEMFSVSFNFDAINFIKELKINLFRKVKRMKDIEKRNINCLMRIL